MALAVLSRGAESWWGCSSSRSDSGLLIDSDSGSDSGSGSDSKYEINNTLIVESLRHQSEEETRHFLLTSAFIPSDRRSLSQLSFMPDHLIRIGNGVMAVSRTFAWWSTCALRAICVRIKRSYCPSFSCTHGHYDAHAGAAQLHNCMSTWFRSQHGKKCGAERREPRGSTWCC